MYVYKPTDSSRRFSLIVSAKAIRKSFHTNMITMIAAARSPGCDIGNTIL